LTLDAPDVSRQSQTKQLSKSKDAAAFQHANIRGFLTRPKPNLVPNAFPQKSREIISQTAQHDSKISDFTGQHDTNKVESNTPEIGEDGKLQSPN